MISKSLKPCPFCGSTKLKIDQKKSSTTKWNKETSRLEKLAVVTVRQEDRQHQCMLIGMTDRQKYLKKKQ